MRRIIALLLLSLLTACGNAQQPAVGSPSASPVPAVGELLAQSAAGTVRTVGFLAAEQDGAVLREGLSGEVPAPALWIAAAPQPPADATIVELDGSPAALVEASGQIEGPAAFGPGGRYAFQLAAPTIRPLTVREIDLPLLLRNSGANLGQPVRLRGELLLSSGSAILVERLGTGGVPAADALQLKIAPVPADAVVLAALRPAASGQVRFGPVEVVGLWRGDRLYPLAIRPL